MLMELVKDFEKEDEFCIKNKLTIDESMIDILMSVLDLDGNGTLDQEEILGVLVGRNLLGQKQAADDLKNITVNIENYVQKFLVAVGLK
jgi:uncharacterized protein (DUF2342 family)